MKSMRCCILRTFIVFILYACSERGPSITPVIAEEKPDGDSDIGDVTDADIYFDRFEDGIDQNKWERVTDLWGQPENPLYAHGGVIAENVYTQSGYLVLKSLGDLYEGSLRGPLGHTTRLGGVIKSKKRFASGRFEIKMKVLQVSDMGVLSTAWVYWYKEISRDQYPEAYAKAIAH